MAFEPSFIKKEIGELQIVSVNFDNGVLRIRYKLLHFNTQGKTLNKNSHCCHMDEKLLVTIRKFKTEDINQINKIEEQAFPKTAYSKQTFLNYGNSFPDTFSVIETGDDIVGYILFTRGSHIHSTAVKRTYRRMGFGRMLFMHAVKYARKRLWLEVRSKNSGAIAFYKSLGMKITGKIPSYYGNDDALIMVMSQKE